MKEERRNYAMNIKSNLDNITSNKANARDSNVITTTNRILNKENDRPFPFSITQAEINANTRDNKRIIILTEGT